MTTVLLTGASGYIGKHIALQLLNDGYTVRASVRKLSKGDEVRNAVAPHISSGVDLASKLSFVELDLEKDAGWSQALVGIDVLMHTASPFPLGSPKDENELIRPAVEGTLRALRAAKAAGITRVILTSSMAAIFARDLPAGADAYDESMWTDINHPAGKDGYIRSKTLAEQAAWDFIKNQAPEIGLTVINPALVLGAPLDNNFGASISLVERLLKGKDPMVPDLNMPIVDVKDVARMHVQSIKVTATAGERILSVSETKSFMEIAKLLKLNYPQSKVKTAAAPNLLIKFLSLFDSAIKSVVANLGKPSLISHAKAERLLGISFIPAQVSILESADYLYKNGLIKG
jgi:dihydroflavonol-4-reductase